MKTIEIDRVLTYISKPIINGITLKLWASLVAQLVKNLPAMREPWVWSLDWEDPLEKGMAAHFSILAWRILWTEEPGRPQSLRVTKSQTWLSIFHSLTHSCIFWFPFLISTMCCLASLCLRFFFVCLFCFLLYNTVLVLPYIDMNLPRVYMSSQTWTPLPLPTPYHLSGSSPCTSSKHPVSCIEHRLAIIFLHDSIHVSMPFSQIIPPSPSPSESKRLFYTSVSLLLSHIQGHHYHLSKFHIYVSVYCIGVFLSGLLHSV